MALPKKFKLVNFDWTIESLPQEQIDKDMAAQGPAGQFGGYCNKMKKKIAICDDVNGQEETRMLLHELLHACFIKDFHVPINFELEEKIVQHLEERLTDLIKNNPKLINYLQENL